MAEIRKMGLFRQWSMTAMGTKCVVISWSPSCSLTKASELTRTTRAGSVKELVTGQVTHVC